MVVEKVEYSKRFIKSLKKAPRKIQVSFRNRFEIFLSDPFNPILNNHALRGKYAGYRSFNVTGDWRAVFKQSVGGKAVYFIIIGKHSKLYK